MRKKKVDIDTMTMEQIDELSAQIGEQISTICAKTTKKINSLIKNYGMGEAKICITFEKPKEKQEVMQENIQEN